MEGKSAPIEAKGRVREPSEGGEGSGRREECVRVRLFGRVTSLTVPPEFRRQVWPAFKRIARLHFGCSASKLLERMIRRVVQEHTHNPQSSLEAFFEAPDMPALPTIGRGARVDWSRYDREVLSRVLRDARRVEREVSRVLSGLRPGREEAARRRPASAEAALWEFAEQLAPGRPLEAWVDLLRKHLKQHQKQEESEE